MVFVKFLRLCVFRLVMILFIFYKGNNLRLKEVKVILISKIVILKIKVVKGKELLLVFYKVLIERKKK